MTATKPDAELLNQPMEQPAQTIVVDLEKLREYCLSASHPRGRHKARVFRSRLGITQADAELVRQALLDAAQLHHRDLHPTVHDRYGQRYVLDFEMTTSTGSAVVRSSWIVRNGDDVLRFITCYVL